MTDQPTVPNRKHPGLARGLMSSYVSLGLTIVISTITTPLILRGLGPAQFGLLALAQSLAGYLGLIELGTGTAAVRRVASAFAHDDDDEVRSIVGSSLAVNVGFMVLAVGALFGLIAIFPAIFTLQPGQATVGRVVLLVLGCAQIMAFLSSAYVALLFGGGRIGTTAWAGATQSLLTSILAIVAALSGAGVGGVAAVSLIASVFATLNLRRLSNRHWPALVPRLRNRSQDKIGILLRSGSRNAIVALTSILANGSDLIIVGVITNTTQVAGYALASRAVGLGRTLATRLVDALVPSFASAHARGDRRTESQLFTDAVFTALAVGAPLMGALCLTAPALLRIWVGNPPGDAVQLTQILALGLVAQLPGHCSYTLLSASERMGFLMAAGTVGGVANCGASVILGEWLGAIGPAISLLATALLFDLVVLPIYVMRTLGSSYWLFARHAFGPHLAPIILQVGTLALVRHLTLGDWPSALVAVGSVIIYVAVLFGCAGRNRQRRFSTGFATFTPRRSRM